MRKVQSYGEWWITGRLAVLGGVRAVRVVRGRKDVEGPDHGGWMTGVKRVKAPIASEEIFRYDQTLVEWRVRDA